MCAAAALREAFQHFARVCQNKCLPGNAARASPNVIQDGDARAVTPYATNATNNPVKITRRI
jgi:hypothetical protein